MYVPIHFYPLTIVPILSFAGANNLSYLVHLSDGKVRNPTTSVISWEYGIGLEDIDTVIQGMSSKPQQPQSADLALLHAYLS